jgi:hypothetical protein
MEFKKIYNDSFSQTHIEIETYIREYLTNEEFSIYDYNTNSNELLSNFHQKIKTDKFNDVEHFKNLYVEFETFKAKIPNDSIEKSFRLKVLPLYNKYRDEKLFDDFSFEYLISEIAIFNAKVNTYRIFSNNYYLIEMIYNSEDYSRYEIKEYDQTLESTETFIYYHKKMYSYMYDSNKQLSNKKIMQNEKSLVFQDEKANSINLNDKEIALIMYFQTEVLKNNLKIPSTEIYKTYSLINVRPYDSFANDYSFKSTFQYKIITGVYGKVNFKNLKNVPKIEIEATIADINELQKKIKPLNLININKEINLFSNKLQAVLSK